MVAMTSQQGPWPKCLGMLGDECVTYIESVTTRDRIDIQIIEPGSIMIRDFQKERVRIFIDENSIVDDIPRRG